MCRLAYITKRWRSREMKRWFHDMERSMGGHGNGIAIGDDCWKGAKLSVAETLTALNGSKEPALWHTRRASVGDKIDLLCHPFSAGNGWLVHNGHWSRGAEAAEMLGDLGTKQVSDSLVFAGLVDHLGFVKAVTKYRPTGVWLWMHKKTGELSVYKNNGSLHYAHDLCAYGSEPCPQRGDWYAVADGLYLPGDKPDKGFDFSNLKESDFLLPARYDPRYQLKLERGRV